MSAFTRDPRIFTPLIVYHDDPSTSISSPQYQIDRHLAKTTEMLRHNAHLWVSSRETQKQTQNTTLPFRLESPLVSPTASTSTSSWSSTTCEYQQPQRHYTSQQHPQPRASTSKRRRGNLPKQVTEYLKSWLVDHKQHPYPSEKEKLHLAQQTGLTVNQISNWFINARRRILQPMLESESLQARLIGQHLYGLRQYDIPGLRGLPPTTIPSATMLPPPPSSWAFGERSTTMNYHVDADRVTRDTT
ncbi:hypothetical protein K492DRAFT_171616 [Lichtheimia hyalospora FSU 10163]|nr:hypothetical protein K492DRAFT_171616 [Lichtheimia hyalospora FSU 10163]